MFCVPGQEKKFLLLGLIVDRVAAGAHALHLELRAGLEAQGLHDVTLDHLVDFSKGNEDEDSGDDETPLVGQPGVLEDIVVQTGDIEHGEDQDNTGQDR